MSISDLHGSGFVLLVCIEFVPRKEGIYTNLFLDTALKDTDGWYNFYIPEAGDATWEKNVIGYIEPGLSASEQLAARAQLEESILDDLNYVAYRFGRPRRRRYRTT